MKRFVKIGSAEWIAAGDRTTPPPGHVPFDGPWPDHPVWDSELGVVRNATTEEQLLVAKHKKKDEIRTGARSRILAEWPIWAQLNCESGIYPAAEKERKDADVTAVIAASNLAEDAVDDAPTMADVEAVTPLWPSI